MHRGFFNSNLSSAVEHRRELIIPEDLKHRFLNILRLNSGDKICLFDGAGHELTGKLDKRNEQLYLIEFELKTVRASSSKLILVQALCTMSKLEDIVRKTTELGIDEIIFWQAERSIGKWDAKKEDKIERLNRVANDASRQSERAFVPNLQYEASLALVLAQLQQQKYQIFFGEPRQNLNVQRLWNSASASIAILIGPEGGLSDLEIELLKKSQAQAICYNPHVLRVETAAIAAIALCKALTHNQL